MLVRKTIAALIPVTLLSVQPIMAASEGGWTHSRHQVAEADPGLRSVTQQAREMGFSEKVLVELTRIFPESVPGIRINEDVSMERERLARKPPVRTIRVVKSRQVASAVTDEEPVTTRKASVPAVSTTVSKGAGLEEPRPAQLFTEENRDLEDRMQREISAKLGANGFDVQAVNVKMESLTTAKVIVLATTSSLTEANAKEKLQSMRTVVERDVLGAFPSMKLTKGSSFGLASASGGAITETSAMAFELDDAAFQPALRQKNVAVATPRTAEAAVGKTDEDETPAKADGKKGSSKRRRRATKTTTGETVREPTAVSLQEKEKAEQARQKPAAPPAPLTPPKPAAAETITPSESDFQD